MRFFDFVLKEASKTIVNKSIGFEDMQKCLDRLIHEVSQFQTQLVN